MREFEIYRTKFPAIFRFGELYFQEYFDIHSNRIYWRHITVEEVERWGRGDA